MNWILKNKKIPREKLASMLNSEKKMAERINDFVKNKIVLKAKNSKAFLTALFLVSVLFWFGTFGSVQAEESGVVASVFIGAFKAMLVAVLNLTGFLLSIAATLFDYIVKPENMNNLLNSTAVRDVWVMVRDFLNMTFILVLLFSAFCTIFQIDKWNLKKVWLNILINALLVNFSFPIARFFIDISNVAFYYFLNNLFPTSVSTGSGSIFASFGAASNIGNILAPDSYANYEVSYLIAMIIVLFVIGMTLMVIAGLFVVRLIALSMLVMFSPVGFVGYIFPSTATYADDWWKKLFNYAFFAPIMVFFMAIALKITEVMGQSNIAAFKAAATQHSGTVQTSWFASMAFVLIPVIVLWIGIGVAKGMSIAGAETVVSNVKKGGKWVANAPGHYSGVYGATKKAYTEFDKKGKLFGKKIPLMGTEGREEREARWAGGITGGKAGYDDAKRDQLRKEASEMREHWKKAGGASNAELQHAIDNGNQAEKMAAALEMSEKNGFKFDKDEDPSKVLARYQAAKKALAGDKVLDKNFNDKVEEKHVKLIIENDIATNTDATRSPEAIYKEHLDKLTSTKLAGQKGLAENKPVAEYLANRQRTGSMSDRKFVANVLSGMSTADRIKLNDHGTSLHV